MGVRPIVLGKLVAKIKTSRRRALVVDIGMVERSNPEKGCWLANQSCTVKGESHYAEFLSGTVARLAVLPFIFVRLLFGGLLRKVRFWLLSRISMAVISSSLRFD